MYYQHETQERKPNTHPICTALPAMAVDPDAGFLCNEYLLKRELDPKLAQENGWFPSRAACDSFLRIVIPAQTHKTGHVYFQARDVSGKAYLRYQSPRGPRHEALIKVVPKTDPKGIVVLEGPCCCLAAAGAGYIGYGLMGMKPSRATLAHLALLIEDNNDLNTLILLDRDSGGSAVPIATFLASQGYCTKIGQFTKSKDLAELLPKERERLLDGYFKLSN